MADTDIVLVGLGASYATPGIYIELDFAKGPVAGSGAARGCLLMGNASSAGTATRDTVVYSATSPTPCQTEDDVIGLFGDGSQLHRMFLRFVAAAGPGSTIPLSFLAVTSSAGDAASTTQVIATSAASGGTCRVWCVDAFVDTAITTGQTAIEIASAIVASVNSQTQWPVTAANDGGTSATITYTAVDPGPEGNWIKMQALITPGSSTIGTTTTMTANTALSGGTTADVNTTALDTIVASRFYYIVPGDSDATNVGRLVTQVNQQAEPTTGIRQRVVFGSSDTLANTITIATGINAPRAECVWGSATDCTPAELAAGAAAIYMTLEMGAAIGVARKNFSLFPTDSTDQAYWPFVAGRAGAPGAPTKVQVESALSNGVTPITALADGSAQLVKGITTYSLNGSVSDFRTRNRHIVTVCDYWCDDVQAITQEQYGGRDLLPDPVQGQPPPGPQAVTPTLWGNTIKRVTSDYGSAGQWSYPPDSTPLPTQAPADVLNALMAGPFINGDRMSIGQPLSPVNIADQFAVLASQVG